MHKFSISSVPWRVGDDRVVLSLESLEYDCYFLFNATQLLVGYSFVVKWLSSCLLWGFAACYF